MQIRFIPASDRFGFVTGYLCEIARLVGPRRNLSDVVIERIRSRVWGLWLRFASLTERVRSGKPLLARPRSASAAARGVGKPRAPDPLPRERGWLLRWLPEADPQATDQMELMLKQPDLKLLIAVAPQVRGILRPMCHMLGISLPAILRLPRRPRVRAAEVVPQPEAEAAPPPAVKKFPPAPDWMVNQPGAILKPDGSVWMRFGGSSWWRKPDMFSKTLEEAQRWDPPQRIWPREE